MGSLAILPSARTLPEGGGPVVTVSLPSGVPFVQIPSVGITSIDTDVLPPLTEAAVNDLCAIATSTRDALTAWTARHLAPEAGA